MRLAIAARLLLCISFIILSSGVQSKPALCFIVADPVQALLLLHVGDRLSPALPKVLIPISPTTEVIPFARSVREANCTLAVGPGLLDVTRAAFYEPSLSILLSRAVRVPFIDYGSLAGEIADSQEHPWFNRVIMADMSQLIATISLHFGWTSIAIISVQNSLNVQFSAADAEKVRIVRRLVLRERYLAEVDAFFSVISEDFSFVPIFVVVPEHLRQLLSIAGLHRRYRTDKHKALIFIRIGTACTGAPPGSFCLTFEPSRSETLSALHANVSDTTYSTVVSVFGGERASAIVGRTITELFTGAHGEMLRALATDAVLHATHVLQAADFPSTESRIQSLVRSTRTEGFTGPLQLTEFGERVTTKATFRNHQEWGILLPVGEYQQFVNETAHLWLYSDAADRIVWHTGRIGGDAPPPGRPAHEAISGSIMYTFSILVVIATLLALWAATRCFKRWSELSRHSRDDPLRHVNKGYFLFASLVHYKELHRKFPLQSSHLAEAVVKAAQPLATQHGVVIVKFVEDHLMLVAGTEAQPLLQFSLDLQSKLFGMDWSLICPKLNKFYEKQEDLVREDKTRSMPTSAKGSSNAKLFNGPRVAMGLACGAFRHEHSATGNIDYVGDSVNVAARVCTAAAGGQVLCTAPFATSIHVVALEQISGRVDQLGHFLLSGLRFPVELMQVAPRELRNRQFSNIAEQGDARLVVVDMDRSENPDDSSFFPKQDSITSAVFETSTRANNRD